MPALSGRDRPGVKPLSVRETVMRWLDLSIWMRTAAEAGRGRASAAANARYAREIDHLTTFHATPNRPGTNIVPFTVERDKVS